MESYLKNISKFIVVEKQKRNVTIEELVKGSEIPNGTLIKLLYMKNKDVKLSTLLKLSKYFNCSVDKIIKGE